MPENILVGLVFHSILPIAETFAVFIGTSFYQFFPKISIYPLPKKSGTLNLYKYAMALYIFKIEPVHVDIFVLPSMCKFVHKSGEHTWRWTSTLNPNFSVLQTIEA
jgi:hypothetical protein